MGSAGLAAASADTQFGAVTVEKEPLGPGIEEPTGPAIELDAEQYAIDYGVTTQEAVRRLERIPELKPVLQGIADAEKGRVAGRSIVHEPEFGGWIYLVGEHEATTATMELLSRNKDVFLELGATHTLAELDAAMSERSNFESIPDSMRARIAYREIDIRSNSLVIAINGDVAPVPLNETSATGPLGSAPIESLPLPQAAAALEDILESNTGLPFTVTIDAAAQPDSIHGGEHNDSNSYECTSAFAVLDGSTRGMLTAGHCGDITTHRRSRTTAHTGSSYTATHQDTVWGDDGDSSWYTTSQWESDDFYASTTTTRDAAGYEVRSNMNGDYVCHFGISSGYSCGTVVKTNHDPSYPACGWWLGCDNRWVKVEGPTLKSCSGDSGGPWFLVFTAYGVHSGSDNSSDCTAAGTDFATFTAMDDVLRDLDLTYATS